MEFENTPSDIQHRLDLVCSRLRNDIEEVIQDIEASGRMEGGIKFDKYNFKKMAKGGGPVQD